MKTKIFFLSLILIFSSGCEKIKLGKEFDCHMGNNYKVNSDLSFIITSLNDSRCPPGSVCGVAGDVHIFISINLVNTTIDTVFYQDPEASHPYQFGEYGFSLLDVRPISTGTRTSKDITIKMLIDKI